MINRRSFLEGLSASLPFIGPVVGGLFKIAPDLGTRLKELDAVLKEALEDQERRNREWYEGIFGKFDRGSRFCFGDFGGYGDGQMYSSYFFWVSPDDIVVAANMEDAIQYARYSIPDELYRLFHGASFNLVLSFYELALLQREWYNKTGEFPIFRWCDAQIRNRVEKIPLRFSRAYSKDGEWQMCLRRIESAKYGIVDPSWLKK